MRGEGSNVKAPEGKGSLGKGKEHALPVGRINAEVVGIQKGVQGASEGKEGCASAGPGTRPGTGGATGAEDGAANMEVDEERGKPASNATRPKAKAKAEPQQRQAEYKHAANTLGEALETASGKGGWAQEPQPYAHPREGRVGW